MATASTKWTDEQAGVCVCELTPAAGTGEAEPAGTGEAWRRDELSHSGLDRNGLCRRPEPGHGEPPPDR